MTVDTGMKYHVGTDRPLLVWLSLLIGPLSESSEYNFYQVWKTKFTFTITSDKW